MAAGASIGAAAIEACSNAKAAVELLESHVTESTGATDLQSLLVCFSSEQAVSEICGRVFKAGDICYNCLHCSHGDSSVSIAFPACMFPYFGFFRIKAVRLARWLAFT